MNSLEIRPVLPEAKGVEAGKVVEFKESQVSEHSNKLNRSDYYSASNANSGVAAKILDFSLAKKVSEGLPSIEKGEVTPVRSFQKLASAEDYDLEKVVMNVVGFVSQALSNLAEKGALPSELKYYKDQAVEGVKSGVADAKQELASMGSESLIERIEKTETSIVKAISELSDYSTVSTDSHFKSAPPQGEIVQANIARITLHGAKELDVAFGQGAFSPSSIAENRKVYTSNASNISFSVSGNVTSDEIDTLANIINQTDDVLNKFYKKDIESRYEKSIDSGYDNTSITELAMQQSSVEANSPVAAYNSVKKLGSDHLVFEGDHLEGSHIKAVSDYVSRMLNISEKASEELGSQDDYNQLINSLVNEMKDVQVPDLLQAINRFHLFNAKFNA